MPFDPSAVELAFNDKIDISSSRIEIFYENFPTENGLPSISLFVHDIEFIKNITNVEKFRKIEQITNNLICPYYPMINVTRHDYLEDDDNENIFHGIYSNVE